MKPKIEVTTRVVAIGDQVSTPINNETVLLHLKSGKYFSLNRVGSFVWEQLQQETQVAQVVDALLAKFDVERTQCEADVMRIIASLSDAGFVEIRS